MSERDFAKIKGRVLEKPKPKPEQSYTTTVVSTIEHKPDPRYPGTRSITVELAPEPVVITFSIPYSLPSVNVLKGGNSKGNYHIRKKLQDEWLSFTAGYLKAAGYKRAYHLINCVCEVRSYYSHHQVDTPNLHTKAIWDALIGRIFDDDGPKYIATELKSSKKCKKGEERTDITIIGTEDNHA